MLGIVLLSLISASHLVTNIPDGMSLDEFKQKIQNANQPTLFAIGSGGWKMCTRSCLQSGDCNPCSSGETADNCVWTPDDASYPQWFSRNDYCNELPLYSYVYAKQCYCSVPTPECSGGADPGDKKCFGDEVYECDNTGNWDYVVECEFDCSGGICGGNPCIPHTSKACNSGDVYWYDSCGTIEEMFEDCDANENCVNAECKVIIPDECTKNEECDQDEFCNSEKKCEKLECGENAVADNHTCVDIIPPTNNSLIYVVIFVLFIVGGLAFSYKKSK